MQTSIFLIRKSPLLQGSSLAHTQLYDEQEPLLGSPPLCTPPSAVLRIICVYTENHPF